MGNRHEKTTFKQPPFQNQPAENFYLVIAGRCIGPFLSIGPLDYLKDLLQSRGVRITHKINRRHNGEDNCLHPGQH
jgi:hypothetical protein